MVNGYREVWRAEDYYSKCGDSHLEEMGRDASISGLIAIASKLEGERVSFVRGEAVENGICGGAHEINGSGYYIKIGNNYFSPQEIGSLAVEEDG